MNYLDFEIEIGSGEGREYVLKVLSSPAGEASARFKLPFGDLELERYLDKLQIALLNSVGRQRKALSQEERLVQEFGQRLFDALLVGEVRSRYDVSQEKARQQNKGLRLKLRIQPAEVAALPWEFLFDPRRDDYVCLSTNTPVVRYLELPQPLQPLAVEAPLRILGMVANPQGAGLTPLDVETEKTRLERALQPLQQRGLAELAWLSSGNWRALQRKLRQGPWHIFHFIGHGRYHAALEQGELAFEDENGGLELMGANRLATLLADHAPLRLAVLNACEGAQGGSGDVFSSTAATLVRRGLPAVIAMQYTISDPAAIEISQAFYEALADGLPVDAATAEARKALKVVQEQSLEWGTPVLYMHAPDGVLFQLRRRPGQGWTRPLSEQPAGMQTNVNQPQAVRGTAVPSVEALYLKGLDAYWRKDWPAAQRSLQEALRLQPDYRDAAAKLAEAERQMRLETWRKQAGEAMQAQEWAAAQAALLKLTAEAPDDAQAAADLAEANRQMQLIDLYAQARQLAQARHWQAVLNIFERIRGIQADYPDPENLLASAKRELALQEKQQKLVDLHRQALAALDAGDWRRAEDLLQQYVKLAPGDANAAQLLARARAEQAERRKPAVPKTSPGQLHRWGIAAAVGVIGMIGALILLAVVLFKILPSVLNGKVSPTITNAVSETSIPVKTEMPAAPPASLVDEKGVKMALIPAGEFQMGSEEGEVDEKPVHAVTLDVFYIDIYEVTNASYAECVQAGDCTAPGSFSSTTRSSYYNHAAYASYPMINLTWEQAQTYCAWRGEGYRLPTEAEWEKAARGGLDGKIYPWGDEEPDCSRANYWGQEGGCLGDTSPVGAYAPNGYGLYDMAGNAWEWVYDWYGAEYYSSLEVFKNPMGPDKGQARTLRGGGWDFEAAGVRVSDRGKALSFNSNNDTGFRCSRASTVEPGITPEASVTPEIPSTPTPTPLPASLVDEKGVTMALIPAGEFQMGSEDGDPDEKPVHAVYLDAFYIDVYEVTNASYAECVQAGGCTAPESGSYGKAEYANHPVVGVSWDQAQAYCTWRGEGYRLPTEAEWEKAARGGLVGKKYPWGDESPDCTRANYYGKDGGCVGTTSPVGSYAPNGYGLYDMAGNVWEWVQDWYSETYYSSLALWRNPFGPETGQDRVARGGAWNNVEGNVRTANRSRLDPSYRNDFLGFRPSRSP